MYCVAILLLLQLLLLAAACCCCSPQCAGWQNLFPWFTASDCSVFFHLIQTRFFFNVVPVHLIPVFSSSSFKHDFLFNVPLGSTVAFSASIILPIIHIIHPRYNRHERSHGGRQPAAAEPLLYYLHICICIGCDGVGWQRQRKTCRSLREPL